MSEQSNKPADAASAANVHRAPRPKAGSGSADQTPSQQAPSHQGGRQQQAKTEVKKGAGPRDQTPGPRAPRPPRPQAMRTPLPPIVFPEELPVSGRRAEIAKAIAENQVIIVSGETGSGKTTQLPKICLELGRGEKGLIGHTQPRRIAASSTAKRIGVELGSPQGVHVGYKVRFNDTLQPGAWIK
ncbi:MAG: ATP-dependent helicase, partial [Pseudomonadota bacterium]|nr:ATP-dependent helicase [Pseudomonadota bacterium]